MAHVINLNDYADYAEQPSLFARLRQSCADYRKYLATYGELNALNDRELADLGLSRLNVRDIARDACRARGHARQKARGVHDYVRPASAEGTTRQAARFWSAEEAPMDDRQPITPLDPGDAATLHSPCACRRESQGGRTASGVTGVMLKLVWVNPRDPRAGDACGGRDPCEAEAQPAGRRSLWERLLVLASGAYSVALFWGLWRMLTS
jgi:uncharacterized protein YjiS (DUF1127 family)